MLKLCIISVFTFVLTGCNGDSKNSSENSNEREFVFGINGEDTSEDFVAITNDADVISMLEAQLALPIDERHLFISGPIASGDAGHNVPWSWHYAKNEWELAEFSIELCDGIPSFVEADLDYWLNNVGTFCPWASYVKEAL